MRNAPLSSLRRHRWLTLTILGSGTLLACGHVRAQVTGVATGNATVQPAGPRTGTNGNAFLNIEGSGNTTFASFGVIDFSAASFGLGSQTLTGVQGGTFTLSLTESNAAFTTAGPLEFYLTTGNAVSISNATGASPLQYRPGTTGSTDNPPYGIDPLLGAFGGNANGTLFDLGTGPFNTTGNVNSGQVDTFTFTLSMPAMQAFVNSLNSAGGGNLRLVIAETNAAGAATFAGATNNIAASRPTLTFTPVFSSANNLYWEAGSSTWTATGGTNWNPTNANPGNAGWTNDGTRTAVFNNAAGSTVAVGAGIQAAGLQFDTGGYTLNAAAAGNTLTLTGSAPFIQVTNAADTATVSVALGGSAGLTKFGAGTLVLGGTNSYAGNTTINAGTVQISADANLGAAGGGVALNGGTLHAVGNVTMARAFTGSGGVQADAGSTVSTSGAVNVTNLTLPAAGTFALTNSAGTLAGGASNAVTGTVTFTTAGGTLTTADLSGSGAVNGNGIISLGGVNATQASGGVTLAANALVTGTVTATVTNAGATLTLPGGLAGAAVIAKTGAGTLVLGGDNSSLSGTGTTAASFRQGTAGANPAAGGTISIAAGNPNPNNALGTAQFQANGGTLSNDTGTDLSLPASVSISVGAQNAANTPGGFVLASATGNKITVNGSVGLFRAGSVAYQHAITVNTPTTFTGMLTATNTAFPSTGLTILGNSTLTLAGTQANAFTEVVTIATGGANSGVVLAAAGAFAQNTGITLNSGAVLTINTGATAGTVDTINNAALVSLASGSKVVLSIGAGRETVGGLYLPSGDGTLAAGFQPAGTYGSTASGAQYQDNNLFSGTGVFVNLGTAVPEPSTWAALLVGMGLLGRSSRLLRRK